MKPYNAKTTFSGYRIGLGTPDLYVGVPDTKWTGNEIKVAHGKETKEYIKKDVVKSITFDHRNKPGTYELLYVLWKEVEEDI